MGFRNTDPSGNGPGSGSITSAIEIGDPFQVGGTGKWADAGHQHAFPAPPPGYATGRLAGSDDDGTATAPMRADARFAHTPAMHAAGGQSDLSTLYAALVHAARHAPGGGDDLSTFYAQLVHAARHAPGGADSLAGYFAQLPPTGQTVFVATTGNDAGDGRTPATAKATFQAAYDTLPAAGGTIQVGAGNYAGTVRRIANIAKPLRVIGAGRDVTTVTGGADTDYLFLKTGATQVAGIEFEGLTLDLAGGTSRSGLRFEYVSHLKIRRCAFRNVTQWGLVVGVADGTDATIRNDHVIVEDNVFDGITGANEQLLLMNSRDVTVRNNHFANIGASAVAVGIAQKTENVVITTNTFEGPGRAAYYSLSTDLLTFDNNMLRSGSGINGARTSANGAFGATFHRGLTVTKNVFMVGPADDAALWLGATRDFYVAGNLFLACPAAGILVCNGAGTTNTKPESGAIIGNSIVENNRLNTFYDLHPGLLFSGCLGALYIQVAENLFADRQASKSQRFAVAFDGQGTFDAVSMVNNRMGCDPANGRSIQLNPGAALGGAVQIFGNSDYTDNGTTIAKRILQTAVTA